MRISAAIKLIRRIASQDPTKGHLETVGQGGGMFICRFCQHLGDRPDRIEHDSGCVWLQASELAGNSHMENA